MRFSKICVFLALLFCVPYLVSSQCRNLETRPHPYWCSGFYVCRVGFWILLSCPRGLLYNDNIRRCDFPDNVNCVDDPAFTTPTWETPTAPPVPTRTIPTRTTSLPTRTLPTRTVPTFPTRTTTTRRPRGNLTCFDPAVSFLPHSICEYFYKCVNGQAIVMKCHEGLIWNSDRELCDYPENFTCVS